MVVVESASDRGTLVTFIIILGAAAAIYIAMLMFRLAAVALPLYVGIGTFALVRKKEIKLKEL